MITATRCRDWRADDILFSRYVEREFTVHPVLLGRALRPISNRRDGKGRSLPPTCWTFAGKSLLACSSGFSAWNGNERLRWHAYSVRSMAIEHLELTGKCR